MKVKVTNCDDARGYAVEVSPLDADGDVLLDIPDACCWLDAPSVQRLITALQQAIRPQRRKAAKKQ